MAEIRIAIVDDNEELRATLSAFLQREQDLQVVAELGNGLDALKIIGTAPLDVLLLDMIMPGLDGFGVLSRIQQLPPEKRPQIIALTALSRDDFIRRAVDMGVTYYMIKPVELPVLLERIREIAHPATLQPRDNRATALPQLPLEDRLSNLFLTMGMPAHIKGYQYLREAVRQAVAHSSMLGGITKELYPAIAHKFGTTSSKVERAIRHAIEVAWSRGRVDSLNQALGCCVVFPEDKPTNGEFIALLADKLSSAEHTA